MRWLKPHPKLAEILRILNRAQYGDPADDAPRRITGEWPHAGRYEPRKKPGKQPRRAKRR